MRILCLLIHLIRAAYSLQFCDRNGFSANKYRWLCDDFLLVPWGSTREITICGTWNLHFVRCSNLRCSSITQSGWVI